MEKIEIRKSLIINNSSGKKFKKLCTESSLYLLHNEIIKILNSNLSKKREENIEKLALYNIKHCAEITKMLYENNKFYAFCMVYYDEYKALSKCLGKINLNAKKMYCHQLIETYNNIKEKLGLLYYDFHGDNVIINKKDLVLLDIDSCIDYNRENELISIEYLIQMILQIIFDFSFDGLGFYYLSSEERKQIKNILYPIFNYEIDEKKDLSEVDECIEDITNKKINVIKKQLPKSFLYK